MLFMKQYLSLVADGSTSPSIPNNSEVGMESNRVPLAELIEQRNAMPTAGVFAAGVFTAKKCGRFAFNIQSEAYPAMEYRVALKDVARNKETFGRGFAPLNSSNNAEARVTASLRRSLYLHEGDTVEISDFQYGSQTATRWPYGDSVFVEIEYLGN